MNLVRLLAKESPWVPTVRLSRGLPRRTRRRPGRTRAIDPYEPDQGDASAILSAPVLVLVILIPQNQRVRVAIPGVGRMVQRRRVTHGHGNLEAGQRVAEPWALTVRSR
jgi:hypothetical protein